MLAGVLPKIRVLWAQRAQILKKTNLAWTRENFKLSLEIFNLAWKLQSRLKFSILTLRNSHKNRGLVGGSLEIFNLAWKCHSFQPLALPALQKTFVNFFFKSAWGFCIDKGRGFLVNFFWSPFPTKRSTKTPQIIRGKFREKFGAKFGSKIRKIRETFVLQVVCHSFQSRLKISIPEGDLEFLQDLGPLGGVLARVPTEVSMKENNRKSTFASTFRSTPILASTPASILGSYFVWFPHLWPVSQARKFPTIGLQNKFGRFLMGLV